MHKYHMHIISTPTTSPCNHLSRIHDYFFSYYWDTHICTHIYKSNMLSLFSVAHMYVFSTNHLELDNLSGGHIPREILSQQPLAIYSSAARGRAL